MLRFCRTCFTAAALAVFVAGPAAAQEPYRQPPAPIAQILDAEPTPSVAVSPNNDWLLLLQRDGLPPISEVAAPELRLAGMRINPRTSGESREFTFNELRLKAIDGDIERRIETPEGMRITSPLWSADASHISFIESGEDGLWLWVADVATGKARRVTDRKLNGVTGSSCDWISNTPRLGRRPRSGRSSRSRRGARHRTARIRICSRRRRTRRCSSITRRARSRS
jgi:hypothetical protein